ncbi:MAG: fibrobacter succinogenes major paralogous domain-containing protein [Bacteroidales bacterium]|nr:fibrobacter succinogenes major paralogous domain-containing protein [Bacteroidales bacterium]
MKKTILIAMLLIGGVNWVYSQNECPPTVVDIDGNDYSTVMIGTQCWMAQNMRASHDRNGNDIPLGNKLSYTVPYLYLNVSGVTACGYLYNWAAATRVCPKGWHLPTNADWTQLTDYVSSQPQYCCGGRENYIAKALADSTGWNYSWQDSCLVGKFPSTNNSTGFSALPAGVYDGSYAAYGGWAYFWSATPSKGNYANYFYMTNSWAVIEHHDFHKSYGFSVRCIKNK